MASVKNENHGEKNGLLFVFSDGFRLRSSVIHKIFPSKTALSIVARVIRKVTLFFIQLFSSLWTGRSPQHCSTRHESSYFVFRAIFSPFFFHGRLALLSTVARIMTQVTLLSMSCL